MSLKDNIPSFPAKDFPINAISMNLTRRCSLACSYCFSHCYTDKNKHDMTLETAFKVIDWLFDENTSGNSKNINISFWGGEPLLKWDMIQEIVPYAEQKAEETGKKVTFGGTTNVVHLTPDKFDYMDKHNIHFLLSIDGTREHHDAFRKFRNGKGSYDTIVKNCKDILKRWPDSQVRFSYTCEHIHEFMDDINALYELGFKDIIYSPVSEGVWNPEQLKSLHKAFYDVADWYMDKIKSGENIKMKFIEDGCQVACGNYRGNSSPCGAGRGYIGIDVDGSIWPCHRNCKFDEEKPWYEQEKCLGHIDYGILNHELRKQRVEWKPDHIKNDNCSSCRAFKTICTGQCWATNYDICGDDALVPEINCFAAKLNLEQGEYITNKMGPRFRDKITGNLYRFSESANGCECYNVHDNLFGREIINDSDDAKCLCNMSAYGKKPKELERCVCYNVQDTTNGYLEMYRDMSKKECRDYNLQIEIYKAYVTQEHQKDIEVLQDIIKEKEKIIEILEEKEKNTIEQ